jgi:mRNA-degrading endonuclease toxin of MazEF toxin-antitoxin module
MVDPKIRRGSVVLVNFPFADGYSTKVRPAVIITPDNLLSLMNDTLCVFISSSKSIQLLSSDFVIETNSPSFPETGLQFRSTIRTYKIALLEKSLINRVLGVFSDVLIEELNQHLKIALGL